MEEHIPQLIRSLETLSSQMNTYERQMNQLHACMAGAARNHVVSTSNSQPPREQSFAAGESDQYIHAANIEDTQVGKQPLQWAGWLRLAGWLGGWHYLHD